MSSGTVGYTDTRGNKDYLSIIAKQVGKRLSQASDMAGEERAYAAGMAEAGGTSLEEAGIGKGYFFGRALGSRFGGDRIARTKGRMGMGGAGTNPATNYKQRFRGGFDYNVTNQVSNITDTLPLSNAVVTGLRGVQTGLVQVASAISRQDQSLDSLANVQADMAKAIMFNGYLFQMFMSQQKAKSGRASLAREERSIEGGRGRFIGGSSFGGSGGGRGMINVTPRGSGSGGGRGSGGGFGFRGPGQASLSGGSIALSNIQGIDFARKAISAGARKKGLYNSMMSGGLSGGVGSKAFNQMAAGDVVGMIGGTRGVYGQAGIKVADMNIRNLDGSADNIAAGLAKMLGLSSEQAANIGLRAGQYQKSTAFKNTYDEALKKFGQVFLDASDTRKKILMQSMFESDGFTLEFQEALANLEEYKQLKVDSVPKKSNILGPNGKPVSITDPYAIESLKNRDEVFEAVAKKYGDDAAEKFMKLGLFGASDKIYLDLAEQLKYSATAESLMKHFPNFAFENLEQAIVLARIGDMTDQGISATKQVEILTNKMGVNVQDLLMNKTIGDAIIDNTTGVGKAFAKTGSRGLWRRAAKLIPGVGLALGTYFAIERASKGDYLGAGLEIASGLLGLGGPQMAGFGLAIDGFLLGRDMGVVPMKTGGKLSGFPVNSLLSVNGMPVASFNEPGNEESVQITRDRPDPFKRKDQMLALGGDNLGSYGALSLMMGTFSLGIKGIQSAVEGGKRLRENLERKLNPEQENLSKNVDKLNGFVTNIADAFNLSSENAIRGETIIQAPTINNYYNDNGGGKEQSRDETFGSSFAMLDMQEYAIKFGRARKS